MTSVGEAQPVDSAAPARSAESTAAQAAASLAKLGLPSQALPRHIAIIMDGNGRWAKSQDRPRVFGHEQGCKTVHKIVTECTRLGIEMLTIYGFSTENWARPADEVEFLMELFRQYLVTERQEMMDNNIRYLHIGRRQGLPRDVLDELDKTVTLTASNTGLKLAVAINYGSRAEITDAVKAIAAKAKQGQLDPQQITEQTVSQHLYTTGLPDPDLLIRTAGEMRISNYLLWQVSYAEMYVTDACWPDFGVDDLHEAIRTFARRLRKFGGVVG